MTVTLLILQFLLAIQGVESNHGTIINHKPITSPKSIHYGHKAIGLYGIMPNTVQLLDRSPNSVEMVKISSVYEKKIAKKYAILILQAAKGCPLTASILWLKGPNAKPTPLDYTTPRFKRFVAEWEAFTGAPIYEDPVIKKYCINIK